MTPSKALEEAVDAVPPVRKPGRGRPRKKKRPRKKLHADKGYDYGRCRKALRKRGITPRIARRGIESSERLGRHRSVGGGADFVLAEPVSATEGALRTAGRHPPGVP